MFGRSKPEITEPERSPFELSILDAVRSQDDDAIASALLEHDLILPADGPPPSDADGDMQLAVPIWTRDEQQYAIAFTSEAERKQAAPEWAGSITVPGSALFAALSPGLGFALNPGGSFGLAFEPADVERVKELVSDVDPGLDSHDAETGPAFQLGEPAEEDEAVLSAVRTAAELRPEVAELRRALLLVHEEGREPQLVIGVVLDPVPADRDAFDAVLRDVGAELPDRVALAPIGAQIGNPLSTYMLEETEPFYRRSDR